MITLNVAQLSKLRGIKAPMVMLMKAGISQNVAFDYLKGDKRTIVVQHIEIMCRLLNCTPNELFSWQPDSAADDTPAHPLQALRKKELPDVQQHLNSLSIEKLRELLNGK